jgi:hypothetical protein
LPPAIRALVDNRYSFGGGTVATHDPETIVATLRAVVVALNYGAGVCRLIEDWADTIEKEATP